MEPRTPDPAPFIEASFARQSMMATLGATLETIAPGRVSIAAPLLSTSLQQQGYGHAALTFAIGDSAAGYAALTLVAPEAEVLTAEMKINLLAPAAGDRLIAEGRVIKPGRRLIVVQSDVFAETAAGRRHIALMQGTIMPVAL
ncbi:MAG: PaaI family thioesterase [Pseudomonadota bacterium]